jgi:hypothetical protein
MKESYSKGLTTHTGPESCEVGSNALLEALTGERTGWVLSREIPLRSADGVRRLGRQHRTDRSGEICSDFARSETPGMYGCNLRENREILCLSLDGVNKERVGNSKEAIPR